MEAASNMAVDPSQNARLNVITDYLIATNQAEYNLHVALYQKQIETRHEMEVMIQKLTRKRDALQKVKSDLANLSSRKTPASQARDVLALAEQTINTLQPQ